MTTRSEVQHMKTFLNRVPASGRVGAPHPGPLPKEREHISAALECLKRCQNVPPLPQGEGRGEGKGSALCSCRAENYMRTRNSEQGSTLLIIMMISGIVMLLAGSYLMLTANQNQMIARSFTWNTAMPIAEAGIEEALAHMRQNPTNFSGDGWTTSFFTNFSMQRSLGSDYYKVNINKKGMMINVTSTGYALRQGTNYLSRTVQVQGQVWDFKMLGLVARVIGLGGSLNADSYDSSTNAYSTDGQYVKSKRTDGALVASSTGTFDMGGNADVRGYVASGPGAPLVTMSGSTSVGDLAWGNTKGWEPVPAHNTNGFTFNAPDVEEPFDDAPPPGPGVVNGTSYEYVLKGGRYKIGNLDSAGSNTRLIVTKHSALWVTTNLVLQSITFTNGAHLDLYVSMPSLDFSPALIGGTAPQFSVFGLPSCTYMKIVSGLNFIGTIYAPQMDLVAAGNASICGAVLAKTFNCNGTFDFHYDFATQRNWVTDPIQIVAWNEL